MKGWRLQHPKVTLKEIEQALDDRWAKVRVRQVQDAALASEVAELQSLPVEQWPRCPACGATLVERGQQVRQLTTQQQAQQRRRARHDQRRAARMTTAPVAAQPSPADRAPAPAVAGAARPPVTQTEPAPTQPTPAPRRPSAHHPWRHMPIRRAHTLCAISYEHQRKTLNRTPRPSSR